MVLSFPFSFGFGFLCVLGSIISFSSGDWLGVWVGLELNLLGFIPLVVQGVVGQNIESSIKYFIVQALGSGFILLGGLAGASLSGVYFGMASFSFWFFLCVFGIFLKLGLAPFHWWVPSVMGGLGWFSCGVLMTWQKLAPFLILCVVGSGFIGLFVLLGCFSSVLGGVMGVGQVQVRVLMAYSSISHWGWVVVLVGFSLMGAIFYYSLYVFITLFLFYFLGREGIWRSNDVSGFGGLVIMLGFLSLGGLPPFTGFLPKWAGLQIVSSLSLSIVVLFLVLGAVLSLYYYLGFLFVFFVGSNRFYNLFASSSSFLVVGFGVLFLFAGFPFYEVFYYCLDF